MPDSCRRSMPLTADRAMTGAPSAPYATGAVLAMSDRPAACKGANPNPINMAAVTATGVPKPAAPSKKAPKEKAMNRSEKRRVGKECGSKGRDTWSPDHVKKQQQQKSKKKHNTQKTKK